MLMAPRRGNTMFTHATVEFIAYCLHCDKIADRSEIKFDASIFAYDVKCMCHGHVERRSITDVDIVENANFTNVVQLYFFERPKPLKCKRKLGL